MVTMTGGTRGLCWDVLALGVSPAFRARPVLPAGRSSGLSQERPGALVGAVAAGGCPRATEAGAEVCGCLGCLET